VLGSSEKDQSAWIWRFSVLSNLLATATNIFYATNEHMTDLYPLHLANTVCNFLWWILFAATLLSSPGYVVDPPNSRGRDKDKGKARNPHSYGVVLEALKDEENSPDPHSNPNYPNLCHTCGVLRPLRSKHCKVTRKCVLKFDHFWYTLH
jgi:hypothetical protein